MSEPYYSDDLVTFVAALIHHEGEEPEPSWRTSPTCGTCRRALRIAERIAERLEETR